MRLTALGLFLVFGVSAYAGANIVVFENLERSLRSQSGQPLENILRPVSTWMDVNGVATRARSLALNIRLARTPGDAGAIEAAVDDIAKASPASVGIWQARAKFQQARGAPIENVLPGFRMSALTGSHEAYHMAQRAVFGLEHWNKLPQADRATVIADLVGSAELLSRGYSDFRISRDSYRRLVAGKSQAERDEIRTAVMSSGRGTEDILQALGL